MTSVHLLRTRPGQYDTCAPIAHTAAFRSLRLPAPLRASESRGSGHGPGAAAARSRRGFKFNAHLLGVTSLKTSSFLNKFNCKNADSTTRDKYQRVHAVRAPGARARGASESRPVRTRRIRVTECPPGPGPCPSAPPMVLCRRSPHAHTGVGGWV
jgi:hypothetical protein